MTTINNFISGGIMVLACIAALIFARFWQKTYDRLFLIFSLAFFLLAIERVPLVFIAVENEARTFVYVIRLFAFVLIVTGIMDKNRKASPSKLGL